MENHRGHEILTRNPCNRPSSAVDQGSAPLGDAIRSEVTFSRGVANMKGEGVSISTAVETARTDNYRSAAAVSRKLHERALGVMPGGNTRHSIALDPYPIYAR